MVKKGVTEWRCDRGDKRGVAETPKSFKKVKTSFSFSRGGVFFFGVYPPYPTSDGYGHLSCGASKIYGVAYAVGGIGLSAHLTTAHQSLLL